MSEIQETNNFQIGTNSSKLPNQLLGYVLSFMMSLLCAFTWNMSSTLERLVTKVEVLETNLNNNDKANSKAIEDLKTRIDKVEMQSNVNRENISEVINMINHK
jgi:hypothetical protein